MIVSTISKNLSIAIASVAALTLSAEKAAQAAQVGASAFVWVRHDRREL